MHRKGIDPDNVTPADILCDFCGSTYRRFSDHSIGVCEGREEWEQWLDEMKVMTQEDVDRMYWEENQVYHWGQ